MTDMITVRHTRFETLDKYGNVDTTTYGVLIYDENESHYMNSFPTKKDLQRVCNQDTVWDWVSKTFPTIEIDLCDYMDFNGVLIDKDGKNVEDGQ